MPDPVDGSVASASSYQSKGNVRPILDGPKNQRSPAKSDDLFAWSQSEGANRFRFTAYARRRGSSTKVRINRRGTSGFIGGIDGDSIVLSEVVRRKADISLFDFSSRKRKRLPSQVNTGAYEWRPTLSGRWLMFGRVRRKGSSVLIFDRQRGRIRTLGSVGKSAIAIPGQVNGDWAAWTTCRRTCSAYRMNLSTSKKERVPDPGGVKYGASIAPDGTTYYVLSGPQCGDRVQVMRFSPQGKVTVEASLGRGKDIFGTFVYAKKGGTDEVLFDRVACSDYMSDIYSLESTDEDDRAIPSLSKVASTYQINTAHSGSIEDAGVEPPLIEAWSRDLGGSTSYPVIAEGKVFVTTRASESYGTSLTALDAESGETVWSKGIGGTYYWSNAAYDRGRVFVVNYDGLMTALDSAEGNVDWTVPLPGQYSFSSPPTASNGLVYTGGAGSGGTLYAVRQSDGGLLWMASVANGSHSSPALSKKNVFVSYSCPNVYAFDRMKGRKKWGYHPGCSGGGGKTPVYHRDRLYVRDGGGGYVFDARTGKTVDVFASYLAPAFFEDLGFFVEGQVLRAVNVGTGTTAWTSAPGDELITAPVVVNGFVYVASETGMLYVLDRSSGELVWSTEVGDPDAPDEHNVSSPLSGIGAAGGVLVVATETGVTAYKSGTLSPGPLPTPTPTPTSCPLPVCP